MYEQLDNYAKHSYERIRILQPQLEISGVYKRGSEYFIICNSLDVLAFGESERTVVEVFDNEIRVLGCPVHLVTQIPNGAVELDERSNDDIIILSGDPLNIIDFNKQLSLLIPNSFLKFWVKFNHQFQGWDVNTERTLRKEEKEILIEKISILSGTMPRIEFSIDTNIQKHYRQKTHDPLSISVSKHSTHNFSKALMDKWEEDEQLWSENKQGLFTTIVDDPETEKAKNKSSTCLINGQMGVAHNIRNYLTLFDEVQIIMPIESSYDQFLISLGIQEDELLKLLELNKIKLIFPHSIQRYRKSLLEKAVFFNPEHIMLTRELTYKTILDLKQRNPLVFLPTTIQEKQEILANLISLSSNIKGSFERKWLESLTLELSNTWSSMYQLLSIRAAIGTFNVGLGPIINSMIKHVSGKDHFIEIMQASNSIEWAAANNAVLCPIGPLSQYEERLAYLYSGVRAGWNLELETSPNIATGEILTIAQYVPVVELAQSFTGSEIQRFRQLIVDITHNKSNEEIKAVIQDFNDSVRRFEKNRNRTDSWDVKGITLDVGLEAANSAIPFAGFVSKQLGRLIDYSGERHSRVGETVDYVQSKIYRTSPNVILVSKMRDKIKDLL
ncbi:hypothetical protein J7J00_17660 [Bacillus sp. ISL-4]|uniref:hypothetical protein n=1 Tax=Bacillus sp. ISL-4 TaxID=2819125 RepID=UPI001BE5E44A|nr:hypothetical protein [Bacillus sp. ISL-4]MBT2667309.1 hypothetical protein [Bacillus sp. ISL-4]MBT2674185.1 hypothetical protein [Streptomyces sp. ISL-14]